MNCKKSKRMADGGILLPSAPPKSSVVRQIADVPIGVAGGVAGLINAGVGLGDIVTTSRRSWRRHRCSRIRLRRC